MTLALRQLGGLAGTGSSNKVKNISFKDMTAFNSRTDNARQGIHNFRITERRTESLSWRQDLEDQNWNYVECGRDTKACGFQPWDNVVAPSPGMNAGC